MTLRTIFFIFLSFIPLTLLAQVRVNDQSFRETKFVKAASFIPAKVVFENDSIVHTNISIESNGNFNAGGINHVVTLNDLPADLTVQLKVKELQKLTSGMNIQYIEFNHIKAVFQKIGFETYLTRVLYEDNKSRLTSFLPFDIEQLTSPSFIKRGYNSYIQFKKETIFNEQLDLIAIYSPSFAPRRSEKAFTNYFKNYPELVSKIKDKKFLFDAPAVIQLLKIYNEK